MWQFVAIVVIVALTVLWFVRDERRRKDRALAAKAHYFATTPQYRPTPPKPVATPSAQQPRRSSGLLQADRDYFKKLIREKAAD